MYLLNHIVQHIFHYNQLYEYLDYYMMVYIFYQFLHNSDFVHYNYLNKFFFHLYLSN